MQVGTGNVLRGQQQEEEEGQVGRRVTDELDEGFLDKVSQSALWSQQVDLRRREEEGVETGKRDRGKTRMRMQKGGELKSYRSRESSTGWSLKDQ